MKKTAEIISLHPGKQHNLEQAEQLLNHFSSFKHITSLAVSDLALKKLKFLPSRVLSELSKRAVSKKLAAHTDSYPWYELAYKYKALSKQNLSYQFFKKRNRYFQQRILKSYNHPQTFLGFDTSSNLIFREWKGKSVLILDLTIAAPQYKKELAKRYQLGEDKIKNLTKDDEVWYETYEEELHLADYILCGSEFVKNSCLYLNIPEERLKVLPYGAYLEKFAPSILPEKRDDKKIKIAFVGNVSYRKGADVLLRAWKEVVEKYDHAELHFYGNLQLDIIAYDLKNVFFHGFVTQEKLIEDLNHFHISILPTFFEGSSIAIYQCMALGLTVVTTQNCGSVIKNGEDGIIIEYGSEEQIKQALSQLIDNKDLRLQLAKNAMKNIQEYSWDNYGNKLKELITSL